eukprot:Skav216603  [mRNA]  locus=scaffold2855:392927:393739:+ [translate_table: standard]
MPSKPRVLDERLAQFLEHLWLDDINVTYAGHTLSAFRRFYPQLRFKLPVARQFFSNWKSIYVPKQAVPMPATVAMAVAGVACRVSDFQFAALMLLGFAAFLRTGEISALKVSHLHVHENTGDIYIALPATKTSRNRLESVALQDALLASLLCEAMEMGVSDFLFGGTASQFRRQLGLYLSFLHLQEQNFTGYSLRRGGASHAFANGASFDQLLVKGRWQSVKTARQYLDSGRAALIQLHFSDQANQRIAFFHSAAVQFCERLRQERASRR